MNFITNLLTMHNQFKVYHWQTQKKPGSFAQHNAFGTAYDDLTEKIDDFIEINSPIKIDKVEIYNLLGTMVVAQELDTNRIDVTNLQSGVFLISLYSGEEKIVRKIIIK